MASKSRLGKGLDALIPPSESALTQGDVQQIAISQIRPNPHQPRRHFGEEELTELADSIRAHGIIQPLIARSAPNEEIFTLIAGERRLQAARLAGLERVPVMLREAEERELVELALVENVQRSDLGPLEAAEAYRQLHDEFGLSHKQIAEQVGKSRAAVTNTLSLLDLSGEVKRALAAGKITEGHGRALKALETAKAQNAALSTILDRELSVRQSEELVRKLKGRKEKGGEKKEITPEVRALQDKLRDALGTKVNLQHGKKGGRITLYYYSDEELDSLIDQLLKD